MSMQIAKIMKINPRKIWENESRDFTPWLASNIEFLNEKIGLDITVISQEQNVGPYKLDIYGEDTLGNKIIIENQLEKTDHSHLGQLLTYMVNLDANIAIWVTERPIEEHRKVVEWLNETTPDNMVFYLVQIEGVQFEGSSTVGPLLTVVEGPTLETKKIGDAKKEFARSHRVRYEYWTQFIEYMNSQNSLLKNISPSRDSWLGVALGLSGVGLNIVIAKNYARVELYINRGDIDRNKMIFDELYSQKDTIEKAFGAPLIWERMDDRVTSRIKYQLDNVSVYNEKDWLIMNEFLAQATPKMHIAFKDSVAKLKYKLRINNK